MTIELFHMEKLAHDHVERERVFWAILAVVGRPRSLLDVGCGDGWLVRAARQVGCKPAMGVGSETDREAGKKWATILVRDLSWPFQLNTQFDLVTCFVGAHSHCVLAHVARGGRAVVASPEAGGPLVRADDLVFDSDETFRLNQALDTTSFEVFKCV